jgi:site-specific DNA-methyltransferase (adenine-specific)
MTLQLLNGDCLELMKTLPDKSVDLFLCDLPYGCLSAGFKSKTNTTILDTRQENPKPKQLGIPCAWDIPIDLEAFWVQVKRLCKDDHTPVLMFCTTKFGYELIKSNEDWFRYDLVWNKQRGVSFLQANKMPMRSHELIYVFSKKGATYYRTDIEGEYPNTRRGRGTKPTNVYNAMPNFSAFSSTTSTTHRCAVSVIDIQTKAIKGRHPTQKPDDLYEWLITRYSKEGDTILDATAGSFASCFTSQKLGRNAIGIELNKEFYDKAVEKNTPKE